MERMNPKKFSAQGIIGIFKLFDQFFDKNIHSISAGDIKDKDAYIRNLHNQLQKARQYSKIGMSLSIEISDMLSKSDKLISSVSEIQEGFSDARKGLRGVSNISEEAVTGIQAASDSIQESIDALKKDMDGLVSNSGSISGTDRDRLIAAREKVDKIGDISFNIVMELQFQDILRQQLSAVADILAKTRSTLAKGIENIAGTKVEISDEEEGFAVTDDSILRAAEISQDEVDAIFNAPSQNECAEQDDIDAIINANKKNNG